jgi:hypothetical protein
MINSQLSKLKSIKGFKMANLNLNINSLLKSIDQLIEQLWLIHR